MSLRDLAAKDFGGNLSVHGVPVKITSNSGDVFHVKGHANRIDARYDPQTNQMILARETVVSIRHSDLPNRPGNDWKLEFIDATGVKLFGTVEASRLDATLGFYNIIVGGLVVVEEAD